MDEGTTEKKRKRKKKKKNKTSEFDQIVNVEETTVTDIVKRNSKRAAGKKVVPSVGW